MKTKMLLLATSFLISSTLVTTAQSVGQSPDEVQNPDPSWRHSRAAQEQLYRDRLEKERFHSLLPKHLDDMNYSTGANLFADGGLPGPTPGSSPLNF